MRNETTTQKSRPYRWLQACLCSAVLLLAGTPLSAHAVEEASTADPVLPIPWSTMTVHNEEPDTTERFQGVVLTDVEGYDFLDLGFAWSVDDDVPRSGAKEARFTVVVEQVDLRDPDQVTFARTAEDSTSYTVTGAAQADSGALQVLVGLGDLPTGYLITQQINFWDGESLDAFAEPEWKTETQIMKLVVQPVAGVEIDVKGLGLRCFSDGRAPSGDFTSFGSSGYQIMTMDQGEGCAIDPLTDTAGEQGHHFNKVSSYSCFPLRDFLCLVYVRATAGGGSVDDSFCDDKPCLKASIEGGGYGPFGTVTNWGRTFDKLHMAKSCSIPTGGGTCNVPERSAHKRQSLVDNSFCALSEATITSLIPLHATAKQLCW